MTSTLALPALRRRIALLAIAAALAALAGCASTPEPIGPDAVAEPEEPVAVVRPAAPPAAPTPEPPAATPEEVPRIANGEMLFQRMAAGFQPPVCVRGEHNRSWRRRYAGHAHSFEGQLRRSLPLMAWVVEQVEARELPMEFALIPLIESGFRPDARGPGGPKGLWQMIGSTARNHGIAISGGYDGRLSPVDSTRAALDYLELLHAEFGDWRATAMAYNAGEGRLRRAFARSGERAVSGERRLPPGLSSITYAYVAKLHAIACLVVEPGRHGLTLPTDTFAPLEVRPAPPGIARLEAVAAHWNTDSAALRALNPAWKRGFAGGPAPRLLLVPSTAGDSRGVVSAGREAAAPAPSVAAAAPSVHTVRRGDTLWKIARRYGTTVRALAAINGLRPESTLALGLRLRIPD